MAKNRITINTTALRNLMKNKGYTMTKLSKILGISQPTLTYRFQNNTFKTDDAYALRNLFGDDIFDFNTDLPEIKTPDTPVDSMYDLKNTYENPTADLSVFVKNESKTMISFDTASTRIDIRAYNDKLAIFTSRLSDNKLMSIQVFTRNA